MKKNLALFLSFLTGCATELPVLERYDVPLPTQKTTLAIETMPDGRGINPLDGDSVKQTRNKYFTEAGSQEADFILKETAVTDCSTDIWGMLTKYTAGIVPSWGGRKCVYSYSLTQRKTGKTVFLADIFGETKFYFGWLMMPAIFFPDMKMDTENTLSRTPAMVSAIREAAFLIYDVNAEAYANAEENRLQQTEGAP